MNQIEKYHHYLELIKARYIYIQHKYNYYCNSENSRFELEEIILHLRKILELIAYASVFSCEDQYTKHRFTEAGEAFKKEFNARTMLYNLSKLHPNFYPQPFEISNNPIAIEGQTGRKITPYNGNYLTKKQFEKLYDRLGKFLHAENPWGSQKGYENLEKEIPSILEKINNLLAQHLVSLPSSSEATLWLIQMGDKDLPIQSNIANKK